MMEQAQSIGEGLTFEKVWAAMQESNRRMEAINEQVWEEIRTTARIVRENSLEIKEIVRRQDESDREFKKRCDESDREFKKWCEESDKRFEESKKRQEESDREFKKRQEESDKRFEEFNKRFGDLTNRFGEVVEYMILPTLVEKFRELDFEFTKAHRDTEIADRKNGIFTEVDVFLENGDKVMIVEIKTKPKNSDIDYHVERMEKLRKYADLRSDNRKYLGAVAGVVMSENTRNYALKNGFYVVEPSGETFKIIKPQGRFHPREW
ncbi:MAG: hypothetical protein LBC77_09285 [Spirochaetaceae bacterium]|jgi:hypothetical protein|nr:hypothetical protein [Spirochaetaceae bacterium]